MPAASALLDRLADKFEITDSGCWEWTACRHHKTGYARVKNTGGTDLAHRAAWQEVVGPIPEGLEIDHLCKNRACVNPDHLEPVTRRENIHRSDARAGVNVRKTHCKRGHPFDESNTRHYRGSRICRACKGG